MSESRIHLVASDRNGWPERLVEAAGEKYTISIYSPDDLPAGTSGVRPAKGVVVYYTPDTEPGSNEWFSRIRACVHYVDLPLIAVTADPTPASRAQLLAAGASAVCDAGVEPQQVLKEVENRCNIEPVMEELREQLLDPFVSATRHTLKEMAGAEVGIHSIYRKQGYRIFGDYSALVSLTADTEGTLVLSFPKETSHEIGRRLLAALQTEVTEELVQSCLGELCNIIVGQAKGQLADTHYRFSMSTPTVVSGKNHEIRYKPGLPCLVASFTGEVGDFALQLCMALQDIG